MSESDPILTPADVALWARAKDRLAAPSGGCPDTLELAGYIDGSLAAEAHERLEAHAADCADCRAMLVEARATLDAEPEAVPLAVFRRATALVPKPATPALTTTRMLRSLVAAAAAVALAVGGFRLGHSLPQPPLAEVAAAETTWIDEPWTLGFDSWDDDLLLLAPVEEVAP